MVVSDGEAAFGSWELDPDAVAALNSRVACAVLGLVIESPSHVYDIAQRFQMRFGGFLKASRSGIYATVRTLEEAGLVETMPGRSITAVTKGAKAGATFRATPRGARAFRVWLAERAREDPMRVEMLGRMTLAAITSAQAASDFVNSYEQACMEEARQLPAPSAAAEASGMAGVMERLLVEERRRMIDAQLGWLAYAREEIRAMQEREPGAS